MTGTIDFGGTDFGGITTEEASTALSEALKQVQEDPCYKYTILPMMEKRIRYDESWRGKLFPYSPLDRLKRDMLIMKIELVLLIGLLVGLLILDVSLITMV